MRKIARGVVVLTVERHEAVRKMSAAVLRRAGFETRSVGELDGTSPMLRRMDVDVILREVNLGLRERATTLEQLAATAPELLRRTVLATTTADAARLLAGLPVFAVIAMPFDIDELVRVVAACMRRTRAERPLAAELPALQRFLTSITAIRRELAAPASSTGELLLRNQLRRTLRELSAVLTEAAESAQSGARATIFHAASDAAADLVTKSSAAARRRH